MNRRRHNFSRRGFTVVELLVAMAMTAMLAGALYESLTVAFRAQASATANIESSRTSALAMDLLANDIQNTMQYTAANNLVGNFEGTTSTDSHGNPAADLVFYTNTYGPDHPDGNGEVKEVELTVAARPNGQNDLVRRVSGNLLADQGVTPDEETVCRNITGFSLRYYDGTQWTTVWDSTSLNNTIPMAVEVTIQFPRSGNDLNQNQNVSYVRTFPLICSTAAQAAAASTGTSTQ